MTFVDLVVRTTASLHPDGEPDEFIAEHTAFIRAEGDDGDARRVGKARAYRIHAGLAAYARPGRLGHDPAGPGAGGARLPLAPGAGRPRGPG
jgi:hypothetical protein